MKPIINDFTLRPRIEERQPVIAIACRLTGRYETLPYPEAWECIMKCCTDNHLPYLDQGVEYINVFHDDPTEIRAENCRADVCLAAAADCPSAQADIRRMRLDHHHLRRITIPGGRYLVFTHVGPYENLGKTYLRIYYDYLPKSRHNKDPRTERSMFEKYLNDPSKTHAEELLTEIWIPVL